MDFLNKKDSAQLSSQKKEREIIRNGNSMSENGDGARQGKALLTVVPEPDRVSPCFEAIPDHRVNCAQEIHVPVIHPSINRQYLKSL